MKPIFIIRFSRHVSQLKMQEMKDSFKTSHPTLFEEYHVIFFGSPEKDTTEFILLNGTEENYNCVKSIDVSQN